MKRRILILTMALLVFMITPATFASEYSVVSGDVMWKIAMDNQLTLDELITLNPQIENPDLIEIGDKIVIDSEVVMRDAVNETTMIESRGIMIPVTVVVPAGSEDAPLVVMSHGHGGNKDQDGAYLTVANLLEEQGIASVRMDYSGCGESTESFSQGYLSNMVTDTLTATDYALTFDGVDSEKMGILGYSMGGKISSTILGSDDRFDVSVMWSPAGTNGMDSLVDFLGGQEAIDELYAVAAVDGTVDFTNPWGFVQVLDARWFEELNASKSADGLANFDGDLLVIYGDLDTTITPETSKAVAEAAINANVEMLEITGADHGYGIYSGETNLTEELTESTVKFFSDNF